MGRRNLENIDQKIIRQTIKLGAQDGVDHVSTLELAKKLGISEGTIFVHFKTKDNLINAAFKYICTELDPYFQPAKTCEPTQKAFFELWKSMVNLMMANPDYTGFYYSYYGTKQRSLDSLDRKQEYIDIVNHIVSVHNNPFNDERALDIWMFIIFGTIRYALMKINHGASKADDDESKFVFKLICGHLFEKFERTLD